MIINISEQPIPPLFSALAPIIGSTLTISASIWRNRPTISKMEELGVVINYANNMKISERK